MSDGLSPRSRDLIAAARRAHRVETPDVAAKVRVRRSLDVRIAALAAAGGSTLFGVTLAKALTVTVLTAGVVTGGVLALRHPGAIVENKHAGFALHWRAAPAAGAALRDFAEAAVARLPGHRLQLGDHVAEVVPAGGDKGRAIEDFLAEAPFAGRFPVYAGDDLTDEAAFRAINARDGASVLVGGRGDSAARFGLRDPAEVRAWLDMPAAGDRRSVAQAGA